MSTAGRQRRGFLTESLEHRTLLATFTVNSLADAVANDGQLTLREAIEAANTDPAADVIEFDFSSVSATVDRTIKLGLGELTIQGDLTINGPGARRLTIDGDGGSRVFNVDDATGGTIDVNISGLTLTGGQADFGGAILTYENLTVQEVELSDNDASSDAGAIHVSGGTTTLINSTIVDNHATRFGGGIAVNLDATLDLTGSTVSGNSAGSKVGGIINTGTLNIVDSTITGNTAVERAGGLYNNNAGVTTLTNSIVAGNTSPNFNDINPTGTITGTHNLIGDPASAGGLVHGDANNNIVGADNGGGGRQPIDINTVLKTSLGYNGGPTRTHFIVNNSPVIDAGTSSETFDQRGAPFARVSGAAADIGAYERQSLDASMFVVTTTDDELDYSNDQVSLREAVNSALGRLGAETITFDASFDTPRRIDLTLGDILMVDTITIDGPGADLLTIDAGGRSRFIHVPSVSSNITLRDLTFQNGATDGDGGAIWNESFGSMTLDRVVLKDNSAESGGAIFKGNGDLNITDSVIADNTASSEAGAIRKNGGTVTVTGSTLSGNTAGTNGGAIITGEGDVTIIQSTLSGNAAGNGAAIFTNNGAVIVESSTITDNTASGTAGGVFFGDNTTDSESFTVRNSIIAGNTANFADDFTAPHTDGDPVLDIKFSLIGINQDTGLTESRIGDIDGNFVGTTNDPIDPLLLPLADNGGTTPTHALIPGSPAIDGGDPDAAAGLASIPTLDQRGESRVTTVLGTDRIDMGAFELQPLSELPFPLIVTTDHDHLNVDVLQSGGSVLSLREALYLANLHPGSDEITFDPSVFEIMLTQGELPITDSVSITAPEGFFVTIDAQEMSRVINVVGGVAGGSFIDVQLIGLTLTGGETTGDNFGSFDNGDAFSGGGIRFASGGSLHLERSVVTDNSTMGRGAGGGGIYFAGDEILLIESTVTGNRTDGSEAVGGGIDNRGRNLLLEKSEVTDNRTTKTGSRGGGIHSEGVLFATASVISGNSTSGTDAHGGGIYATGSDLTLHQSVVSDNSTTGINADGGGIHSFSSSITIEQSTVSDNRTTRDDASGGGIFSLDAPITIIESTVADNSTAGQNAPGGGIHAFGFLGVYVSLERSTVSGNRTTGAFSSGGGIAAGDGLVRLDSSTVSGNSTSAVDALGGGIFAESGSIDVNDSTIAKNTATSNAGSGAGIYLGSSSFGTLTIANSIVAENYSGSNSNVADFIASSSATLDVSHSLIGVSDDLRLPAAAVGSPDANSNLVGEPSTPIDAGLEPLTFNGGRTMTHFLSASSPAIDAGDSSAAHDQRGEPFFRVFGSFADIGAYERQTLDADMFVVTTTEDELDPFNGEISLREAVSHALGNPGNETITFSSLFDTAQTIDLTLGEIPISGRVVIDGPGSDLLTIDAAQPSRFVYVPNASSHVTIEGLKFRGGRAQGDGGAILNESFGTMILEDVVLEDNYAERGGAISKPGGNLQIIDSVLSHNQADSIGGAIRTSGGGITITGSTLSDNRARDDGGAINIGNGDVSINSSTLSHNTSETGSGGAIASGNGDVTIRNSTFSGNNAASNGGAIQNLEGDVLIESSTITNNSTDASGGGLFFADGLTDNESLTIRNSIVAGNTASFAPDFTQPHSDADSVLDVNYSIVGNNDDTGLSESATPDANGNIIGSHRLTLDLGLGPLQDNGGNTQTHALLPGSPAMDLVPDYVATILESGPTSWWRLDESSGTDVVTDSVGDADGTYSGHTSKFAAPAVAEGKALRLFGTDGVATIPNVPLAESFTVEAWAKSDTPTWNETGWLATARGGNGFQLSPVKGTTNWEAWLFNGNNQAFRIGVFDVGDIQSWHHYALTFDSDAVLATMYLDGHPVVSRGFTEFTRLPTADLTVRIGNDEFGDRVSGDGDIDEVAIYDRSLSSAELQAHFQQRPLGSDQRGLPRLASSDTGVFRVDAGSFEFNVSPLPFALEVNTTDDELDADVHLSDGSDLSLREALFLANLNPGDDEITFASDVFGSATTINLALGELEIADSITITGPRQELLSIDAGQQSRVIDVDHIHAAIDVSISGLTLTGGTTSENGGGIRFESSGVLTLTDATVEGNRTLGSFSHGGGVFASTAAVKLIRSTISGNNTHSFGGGLYSNGLLTISDSVVDDNDAWYGGGIFVQGKGSAVIKRSTISQNTSQRSGGGIFKNGALHVEDSTISGNTAMENGGGIEVRNSDPTTIVGSTFYGNEAGEGGAINLRLGASQATISGSTITGNTAEGSGAGIKVNTSALPVIEASIVASNTLTSGTASDIAGAVDGESSFNLIGVDTDLTGITNGSAGNQIGTAATPIDPLIGSLADNGGSTQTIALAAGSPAIDSGPESVIVTRSLDTFESNGFAAYYNPVELASGGVKDPLPPTVRDGQAQLGSNDGNSLAYVWNQGESLSQVGDGVSIDFGFNYPIQSSIGPSSSAGLAIFRNANPSGGGGLLAELRVKTDQINGASTLVFRDGLTDTNLSAVPSELMTLRVEVTAVTSTSMTLGYTLSGPEIDDITGSRTVGVTEAWFGPVANNVTGHEAVHDNLTYTQVLQTDQRGLPFARNVGGGADIGAFETQSRTFVVDTLTDVDDDDFSAGNLSLREAVRLANTNVGDDTITFDPALTIDPLGPDITLTGGDLSVTDALSIIGPSRQLTVSGNNTSRIFNVDAGVAAFSLQDLSLTNGFASGNGGAILSQSAGTLSLNRVDIDGSSAASGGAISKNDGLLHIVDSVLSDNQATDGRGGAVLANNSDVYATGSTFSENSATLSGGAIHVGFGDIHIADSALHGNSVPVAGTGGGAIRSFTGDVFVTNSTLSGNEAKIGGGIASNDGTVSIVSSTVTGNRALNASSGGISFIDGDGDSDTLILLNSILAGNTGGSNPEFKAPLTDFTLSVEGSLIGDNRGTTLDEAPLGSPDANGNLIGGPTGGVIDPLLAPLEVLDGSQNATHALQAGSPAIDAGANPLRNLVEGVTVTTNTIGDVFPVENLTNGMGLSEAPTVANFSTLAHDNVSVGNAWATDASGGDYFSAETPPVLTFTLPEVLPLTDLIVWGYQFAGNANNNEARTFQLEFSVDGGTTFGPAVTVEHSRTASASEILALGGVHFANVVRMTITDNHAGSEGAFGGDRVGLSEVRFVTGVPTTDQRGQNRTTDLVNVPNTNGSDGTDIGAFESLGHADLIMTGFDVVSDHLVGGVTDVTFTVRNVGAQPADAFMTHVVYSPDGITSNADNDVIVTDSVVTFETGLAAGATSQMTISITLDKVSLYAAAVQANPAGEGVGYQSTEVGHLFLQLDVGDSVPESNETNNTNFDHLVGQDHVTYFPWDLNGNGTVTPVEALNTIRAVGTADSANDFDGNGVVTPLEAVASLQRIGYRRNSEVIDDTPFALQGAVAVPTSAAQPLKQTSLLSEPVVPLPGITAFLVDADEDDLFAVSASDNDYRTVLADSEATEALSDEVFAGVVDWLSIL